LTGEINEVPSHIRRDKVSPIAISMNTSFLGALSGLLGRICLPLRMPKTCWSIPDLLKKDGIEWIGSVKTKWTFSSAIKILDERRTYLNYFGNMSQA
jgi:hypothetical protein